MPSRVFFFPLHERMNNLQQILHESSTKESKVSKFLLEILRNLNFHVVVSIDSIQLIYCQ